MLFSSILMFFNERVMHKERLLLIVALIILAAAARLLPHPANVTPVAAIALFSGAFLANRSLAYIVPLAAMLASDMVIGLHSTMLFVYVGMLMTVMLGQALRQRIRPLPVAAATLASSIIFFVLTNFGTWLVGGLYPATIDGLAACFVAAIPFFTNSLLGDMGFAALLFGVFYAAERSFPLLRPAAA